MTYKINILPNAEDDLEWFRNKSKKDYLKCFDLVRAAAIAPRNGIGKPERLKEIFDPEINEKLQKWRNGNRQKPQGGRLRPLIQGKTVAQRVLEDRG